MEIHDSLNNQFKFYNYISKLNINLIQYLDNNNIDINYYCFFSKIIGNKHYIITSQTTKRTLNGYRLITIQDTENCNNIFEYNDSVNIIFENIFIKVTSIIDDISNISKTLDIMITTFMESETNGCYIFDSQEYCNNILENSVCKMVCSENLNIINNFSNLKILIFKWHYNKIIGENILPNSIQIISFGHNYNQVIGVNVLPISLQSLFFGASFNQIIGVKVLPKSLQALTLGCEYDKLIGINVLPDSLQVINFDFYYDYFKCKKHIVPEDFQNRVKNIYVEY
jgi:hypothetical protein